jgi:D-alanyl-D-alanine carboxypeptidase
LKGVFALNKRSLAIIISSFVVLIMLSGVIFLGITSIGGEAKHRPAMAKETGAYDRVDNDISNTIEESDYTYIPATPADGKAEESTSSNYITESPEEAFIPASEMDLDPSSITVFINKEYALPKDYKPEQLVTPNVVFNLTVYDERTLMRPEAAKALESLFEEAKQQGVILYGVSAYRSYERQYTIFTNNIVKKGKEYTLRYSAVPGTSEHQTGLAIDVSAKSQNFKLNDRFADSPEGKWLAQNAHKYGYIIRYPKGDEAITGYAYEPWHIRYVGEALANYLYTNALTLEEYYHYTPSPDFDFEAKYAHIINYAPPTVTEAPILSEAPLETEDPEEEDNNLIDEDEEKIDTDKEKPPKASPTVEPTDSTAPTDAPEEDEDTTTDTNDIPYEDEQGQTEEEPDPTDAPLDSSQESDDQAVSPTPLMIPTPTPSMLN